MNLALFGDEIVDVSHDPGVRLWRRLVWGTLAFIALVYGVAATPIELEHNRCIVETMDEDMWLYKVVTRDDLSEAKAARLGLECHRYRFRYQWFTREVLNPRNL